MVRAFNSVIRFLSCFHDAGAVCFGQEPIILSEGPCSAGLFLYVKIPRVPLSVLDLSPAERHCRVLAHLLCLGFVVHLDPSCLQVAVDDDPTGRDGLVDWSYES